MILYESRLDYKSGWKEATEMAWLWIGIERPHLIPEWASDYMVGTFKGCPPNLLCVEQITFERGSLVNLIRIFDPGAVPQDTEIENFISFDEHPELILYEGYREGKSGKVQIARLTVT